MQSLQEVFKRLGGDPYAILEAPPNQQFSLIKKQYRSLAMKFHPDRNKGHSETEIFIKINQAYEFLQDEANRRLYFQHSKALEEARKRQEEMSQTRRQLIQDLKRKQAESEQRKQDFEEQIKRRKAYFDRKMKQDDEADNLRAQILKNMSPQNYYNMVGSVIVKWEKGLAFTEKMLLKIFSKFGEIKNLSLDGEHRKCKIVYASVEAVDKMMVAWEHPLIRVELLMDKDKRDRLLQALKIKKNAVVDLTLNSETIERLKRIVNKNSNIYIQ